MTSYPPGNPNEAKIKLFINITFTVACQDNVVLNYIKRVPLLHAFHNDTTFPICTSRNLILRLIFFIIIILLQCCPGYTDTDMTDHRGRKSIEDGKINLYHGIFDSSVIIPWVFFYVWRNTKRGESLIFCIKTANI